MNLSPLQLDTSCFNTTSHYHPSYYSNNNTSAWSSSSSSSSSLLCPSTTTTPSYQSAFVPSALQPIENYCSIESFYPSGSEPTASSSDMPFYSSSSQFSAAPFSLPPPPPSHLYSSDNFLIPPSSSIPMLPQNRANYTRHQLVMLNEIYKKHKYPNSLQKTLIAKYIGVSRDQIRIWFQNKRRKVQLITKGQAKQTKTDVECEYGEYRRHLPNNFLDDLFQELFKARAAPARLPVKRDNNSKIISLEQEQQHQHLSYYPISNSSYYYQQNHLIEHDDSSHEPNEAQYLTNYTHLTYPERL